MVRGAAISPAVGISHGCATHLEPTPKPEVSTVCRHKCGRGTFHLLRKTTWRRRGTECMEAWRDFRCVDVRIKHLKVAFYLLNNPYEVFASFRIFALSELTNVFSTIFLFVWQAKLFSGLKGLNLSWVNDLNQVDLSVFLWVLLPFQICHCLSSRSSVRLERNQWW